MLRSCLPVATSQKWIAAPQFPETSVFPSGAKTRLEIGPPGLRRVEPSRAMAPGGNGSGSGPARDADCLSTAGPYKVSARLPAAVSSEARRAAQVHKEAADPLDPSGLARDESAARAMATHVPTLDRSYLSLSDADPIISGASHVQLFYKRVLLA
jgi:hypothetical protein